MLSPCFGLPFSLESSPGVNILEAPPFTGQHGDMILNIFEFVQFFRDFYLKTFRDFFLPQIALTRSR